MTIQDLGSLGELVAAIATVITLIYLSTQLRQSTDLAQGTAQRDLMNSFQENLDRVGRIPDIWQRGLHEFSSMSGEDKLRFQMAFNPFVNHLEQTLRMLSRGLETQDNVDVYGDICLALIQEPGGREIWDRTRPLFFPMSRAYIDRRLEDEASLPPSITQTLPWHLPQTKE